ncbi:hypothetical protein PNOK_0856500 [Pyrrhoderma noxium]|uniref:Uncharacterized protein n=1 Tax=Pyrrhoderma noxium TaxID=2282107 RepID=A0A286U7X4_9AGAM|nr:hypothetical protein PNOK_0856500 [Pyrrhoderma noxium]
MSEHKLHVKFAEGTVYISGKVIGKRLRTIMEGHRTASVKGNGPYKTTSKSAFHSIINRNIRSVSGKTRIG